MSINNYYHISIALPDQICENPIVQYDLKVGTSIITYNVDLRKDANEIIDHKGNTWLHEAARSGCDALISGFMKFGGNNIDWDIRNGDGFPPLIVAIQESRIALGRDRIIKLLIEAGADVNACKHESTFEVYENGTYAPHGQGWTALHSAALYGQSKTINFLLENGAKITNAAYNSGLTPEGKEGKVKCTPLFMALRSCKKEDIFALIQAGDNDFYRVLDDGTNALHYAASNKDIFIANFLLEEKNVQPIVSHSGLTPLHPCMQFTKENDYDPSFAITLTKKYRVNPFQIGSWGQIAYFSCNNLKLLTCFLEYDPSQIDMRSSDGKTKLYWLCGSCSESTQVEMIKYLLNNGANPKIKFQEYRYPTSLHRLADYSSQVSKDNLRELVSLFIAKGAMIDDKIRSGFYSSSSKDPELEKMLTSRCTIS